MNESYARLFAETESLLNGETDLIVAMANASAAIFNGMDGLNWAGFYRVDDGGNLVLGPFQGKPACTRIKRGRGVCGTALAEERTLLVPDVHDFPGHIACDSASNSEIVVPLRGRGGEIFGVLDIDSPLFSRFAGEEKELFEKIARLFAGF